MLRRFLRSIGKSHSDEEERDATYAEALLVAARERAEAGIADGAEDAALDLVLDAILAVEADDGFAPSHDEVSIEKRRQFGRSYIALLLDNDALPPIQQLSQAELRRPRALLEGFFLGTADVQREAQAVLRFIERKFADGHFAQAALLLQLFDTEPGTRRNNERNLFYERMILRFMSNREKTVGSKLEEYKKICSESLGAPGDGLVAITNWLDHNFGIRFHLCLRRPEAVDAWTTALEGASHDSRAQVLKLVPPRRWRLVREHLDRALGESVVDHLRETSLRAHVQKLTRAIYFVVLATGRTGFEPLILQFVSWVGDHFDTVATQILPDVHRMSTLESFGLDEALEHVYSTYLQQSDFGSGEFSLEAVTEAVQKLHERFIDLDLAQVPEGDYDLGGLVFDTLLGLELDRLSDSIRIHRLT